MNRKTFLLVYDERTTDVKETILEHCSMYNVLTIKNTCWGKTHYPEVHIEDDTIITFIKTTTDCIRFSEDDFLWLLTDIPYQHEVKSDDENNYLFYQQEELYALVVSFLYNTPANKVNFLTLNDPFRYLNGIHRIAAINNLLKLPFNTLEYYTEDNNLRIGWEHIQFRTDTSTFFVDKDILKQRELGFFVFFYGKAIQYKITSNEFVSIPVNNDIFNKVVYISSLLKKNFIEILFLLDDNTLLQISDVPFLTSSKLNIENSLKSFFKQKLNIRL